MEEKYAVSHYMLKAGEGGFSVCQLVEAGYCQGRECGSYGVETGCQVLGKSD
jgi:hypothetical protein